MIDILVDATTGHNMMIFLDAFWGYNQILMRPDEEVKTLLMTKKRVYFYKVMPFRI